MVKEFEVTPVGPEERVVQEFDKCVKAGQEMNWIGYCMTTVAPCIFIRAVAIILFRLALRVRALEMGRGLGL